MWNWYLNLSSVLCRNWKWLSLDLHVCCSSSWTQSQVMVRALSQFGLTSSCSVSHPPISLLPHISFPKVDFSRENFSEFPRFSSSWLPPHHNVPRFYYHQAVHLFIHPSHCYFTSHFLKWTFPAKILCEFPRFSSSWSRIHHIVGSLDFVIITAAGNLNTRKSLRFAVYVRNCFLHPA